MTVSRIESVRECSEMKKEWQIVSRTKGCGKRSLDLHNLIDRCETNHVVPQTPQVTSTCPRRSLHSDLDTPLAALLTKTLCLFPLEHKPHSENSTCQLECSPT